MTSAHEAVEEAISRLTPEALQFVERHRDYGLFWTQAEDKGRLGLFWASAATACLLDLKLIRVYFEPDPKIKQYVYAWTYTGKLVIQRMEPNFPRIRSGDVQEKTMAD